MSKYLVYILLFILFGCSQINPKKNAYEPSKKQLIVNEIRKNTAVRLKREKGLEPCGSGGQMMDQVKMLALSFFYNKPIEIEEGRKLLVYAVETFVSMINEDERIHPYLNNYPFEPKNVEITIIIKNPDYSSVALGKICLVSAARGIVEYEVHDLQTSRLTTISQETFIEAQEKVKEI